MNAVAIESRPFGRTRDGDEVTQFSLRGDAGFCVEVLDYGAIVRSVLAPDRAGRLASVVLGHDDLASYEDDPYYLGAVVGRSAGRIGGASFALDGQQHRLRRNNGDAHLHGGTRGFGKVCWTAEPAEGNGAATLTLRHHSPAGHEGYPGALDVSVTYEVKGTMLGVEYGASTDAPTIVNLTQHSYFNLAGEGTALDHQVQVNADSYAALGADLIPTGELLDVAGGAFDFRTPRRLGARICDDDEQLRIAQGYDHDFALRGERGSMVEAALLSEPRSGRTLTVRTTQPALHLYSGNFLAARNAGVCMETQHFADAPNKPQFPSTVLRPGESYRSRTEFHFAVQQ